jgi:hypothetical protein
MSQKCRRMLELATGLCYNHRADLDVYRNAQQSKYTLGAVWYSGKGLAPILLLLSKPGSEVIIVREMPVVLRYRYPSGCTL